MGEILRATEGISRLVGIKNADVNVRRPLREFKPDHAHWAERVLPSGERFDTRPQLYSWLFQNGLPHFIWAKVAVALGNSPKEVSHSVFERYFAHHGAYGSIEVSGEGLLDFKTGVRINVGPDDPNWNPDARGLVPEIDFRAGFDYPDAPQELRERVQRGFFILLNTSMIVPDRSRPNLDGRPAPLGRFGSTPMRTGVRYMERVDSLLKGMGLPDGINGMVVDNQSRRMIEIFEASRIYERTV